MRKIVMAFAIVAAGWSLVVWTPLALVACLFLFLGPTPNWGPTLSGGNASWWRVVLLWLTEPLLLALIWAAVRSVAGTIALTLLTVTLLVGFFQPREALGFGLVYLGPTLLLIPLLCCRHLRRK